MRTALQSIIAILCCTINLASTTAWADAQTLSIAKNERYLSTLQLPEIIALLYGQKLQEVPEHLHDFSGHAQGILTTTSSQADYLVSLLPIIEYKNLQQQTRFWVSLQKTAYFDGQLFSCRACSADADFMIFAPEGTGFRLINASLNQQELPGGLGQLSYDAEALQHNIHALGKAMMGSYFKAEFSGAGGERSSIWYAVFLAEQGDIQIIPIADAGHDSSSYFADRPELAETTTSTLRFMQNQRDYYPVEIHYQQQRGQKAVLKQVQHFIYDVKDKRYVQTHFPKLP